MKLLARALLSLLLLNSLFLSGSVAAQTCNQRIEASTPDARFSVSGDGTVADKSTGLIWMRCSLGQGWDGQSCRGEASRYPWGSALREADRHEFVGFNDWRLPNKNELETIVETSCSSPAINERIFPATPPDHFWSSSPYAGLANGAWSIDFGYGSVNGSVKSGGLHVRLVRGEL